MADRGDWNVPGIAVPGSGEMCFPSDGAPMTNDDDFCPHGFADSSRCVGCENDRLKIKLNELRDVAVTPEMVSAAALVIRSRCGDEYATEQWSIEIAEACLAAAMETAER